MNQIVINAGTLETRVAVIEQGRLVELHIEREENPSRVGNIYRGRVENVIPGMQAAFVDIGLEKNGFLYVSDISEGVQEGDEVELEDGVVRTHPKGKIQKDIQQLLKPGRFILVQVVKDRLGTKGPRLTTFITIPGRYAVLLPTVRHIGVSRKIEDPKERERLRRILHQVRPNNMGLITRTAGEGRTQEEFARDVEYLYREWQEVLARFEGTTGVGLMREDLRTVLRVVRDEFTQDFNHLLIDNEEEFQRILRFLDVFDPRLKRRVRLYKHKQPIFEKMGIEPEIARALRRVVYLKSGAYLCIDQTEALTAIDVNTGRFVGKRHLEDTVLQTNLEAAEEIARQVRLRDIGGIIVIDFIDMELERNRRKLLQALQEALKRDRAKTTLSEVTELGMIEMTRKRVKHDLVRTLSQPCPYCEGSGMVRSVTTVTYDVLRRLQSLFCNLREKHIIVQVHPDVARRLRGENRPHLDALLEQFKRQVTLESVSDFHIHEVRFLGADTRRLLTT
jgi:ribonuclease G